MDPSKIIKKIGLGGGELGGSLIAYAEGRWTAYAQGPDNLASTMQFNAYMIRGYYSKHASLV